MRTLSVSNIHQRKQKFWISRAGNETRCYLRRLPPRGADQGGHLPADHGAGRLAHGLCPQEPSSIPAPPLAKMFRLHDALTVIIAWVTPAGMA